MTPTKQNPKNSTSRIVASLWKIYLLSITILRFVIPDSYRGSRKRCQSYRRSTRASRSRKWARSERRYSSLSERGCVSRRTPTNEPSHAPEEKRRVNLRTAAWNERSRIKPAKWDYFMTARITAMFYSPISRVPHNSTALNSVYLDRLTIDQRARWI